MTVSLMIARHRDSGGEILELITKLDFACVARIPTVVYSEGWGARPDRSIGNGKSHSDCNLVPSHRCGVRGG